jgi:hypothetical protein
MAGSKKSKQEKQDEALEALGEPPRKPSPVRSKKRRSMTASQRKAVGERLAKARAAKNPQSENKSIHPDVRSLPEEHDLSVKNVRGWISGVKEWLVSNKQLRDSNNSSDRQEFQVMTNYKSNLETYLRTSVYLDNRWGDKRQFSTQTVVVAKAYNPDGTIKRTKGFHYDDVGVWEEDAA